jgi:hypothetical protein
MLHFIKGHGIISNKTTSKMIATAESLKALLAAKGIPFLKFKKQERCTNKHTNKESNQNQSLP